MMSRCVGSSSTSRMRQVVDGAVAGEISGPISPKSYLLAQACANEARGSVTCRCARVSAFAHLDAAVQRLDPDLCVALALLEAQLVARRVFAGTARLRPEAVVDLAVERRDVEGGIDVAAQVEAQVAVDGLRLDAGV